jgi:hypothetical protein
VDTLRRCIFRTWSSRTSASVTVLNFGTTASRRQHDQCSLGYMHARLAGIARH